MEETKQEEGKFVGINWLTGRKIYLTPKEEETIKKQRKTLFKTLWWILGIYILISGLIIALILWLAKQIEI